MENKKPQLLLLEHPRPHDPEREEYVVNAPLSACLMTSYITSFLEQNGISVDVVDANIANWSTTETLNKLKNCSYILIGIRLVYLWKKSREIFKMISDLRESGIKAHINLYGHYSSFAYKKILDQYPFIDSVTIGEPEHTFLELSNYLINNGTGADLSSARIDGLMFRNLQGEFNARKLISNLDELPFPERRYCDKEKEKSIVTYILGSRGCYNNCGFCYLNPFYGKDSNWRGRGAENIFAEINELYRQYGCSDFYFADANFFGQGRAGKERVRNLAGLIIDSKLQINFGLECRANDIDEDTMEVLVKAGLSNLFIGIESGNQATLNSINKNLSVQANKNAINIVRKFGIKLNMGFIMFDRNADLTGIRQNFEFLKELNLLNEPYTTAHLLYHRQSIFEGTPDYNKVVSQTSEDVTGNENRFPDSDNYEILFDFNDRQVSIMADITTNFCSKALSIISQYIKFDDSNKGCECQNSSDNIFNDFLTELNELLINLFNRTLLSIENGILDLKVENITQLKNIHINEIENLAEKHLPQSSEKNREF